MTDFCLVCNQPIRSQLDLLALLSPKKTDQEHVLCANCRAEFHLLGQPRCPKCDREQEDERLCVDCERWERMYHGNFLVNHSLFSYNEGMHELVKNYKKYGDYELRKVFIELIRSDFCQLQYDFYVPLPTDPKHIASRKFDTISSIFEEICPLTYVLEKQTNEMPQSQKDRKQRMTTKQTFYLRENFTESPQLSGRVLLLDDLYTTGRTAYHARDILQKKFSTCQFESFCIIR